jgi:hypothetical protein
MPTMSYQIQGQTNWKTIAANTTPHVLLGTVATFALAGARNPAAVQKTFNATGPQTVEVGAGTDRLTVNVVVFSLTPKLTFADNFTNRSLTDVGVCEQVTLGVTIEPATVTVADAGGLRWTMIGQPGDDADGTLLKSENYRSPPDADGAAFYTAPVRTALVLTFAANSRAPDAAQLTKKVNLELVIQRGFSAGLKVLKELTVHTPQAEMFDCRSKYRHIRDAPSAGFIGDIWLLPKIVSFSKIEWREAGGRAKAFADANPSQPGGYFIYDHDKAHLVTGTRAIHRDGKAMQVRGGNAKDGCWVGQEDRVYSGSNGSYPNRYNGTGSLARYQNVATNVPSTVTWEIYWQYRRALSQEEWIVFQKVEHKAVMDPAGTVTISKGGARKTFALADPTVGYPDW